MEFKSLNHNKKEYKLNYILLLRLANEYYQQALNILSSKEINDSPSLLPLTDHDIKQFYTLINQCIKIYTVILEKQNDNCDKNFFLPIKKEIHITLKLIDLLINYTLNYKLAHILTYKLLIKLSNLNNNEITDEIHHLQFYYTYLIPMSVTSNDTTIKEKSLLNLDILLYKRDNIDTDWLICFHLCKLNYFFKMEDCNNKVDLKGSFEYFQEVEHYLRSGYPKVYSYVKLCEICYHLHSNEFAKAELILESDLLHNYCENDMMKTALYLLQIYINIVSEKNISTIIKEISKILTNNKEEFVNDFNIDLKLNNVSIKCTLLQYGLLKNILLFVQGFSKIQMTYSKDTENYYEIFVKKILKKNLDLNTISASATMQNKIISIDKDLIEYSKFYESWQNEFFLPQEKEEQKEEEKNKSEDDSDINFYKAYLIFLKERPDIEKLSNFKQLYKQKLDLFKFEDIKIYLDLYKYCLIQVDDKIISTDETKLVTPPNYPIENHIFEATKLMIQLVIKMERFNDQAIKSSSLTMEQEVLITNLKNTLKNNQNKRDSNKVFFLEIVLLIIQTFLEDNNKDSFDKFYNLIRELEIRKIYYILPKNLYYKIIKYTISLGFKQESSQDKLLFLHQIIA